MDSPPNARPHLLTAEAVLDIDAARLKQVTKISSAESALAAPLASYDGHEFYPHPLQRTAILASRIMRNHPLPDGNEHVGLILMLDYLDQNGWTLTATPAEIDRTFRAIAARKMTEDYLHIWLISRTRPP